MFEWIRRKISLKIALTLVITLSIVMTFATFYIVESRTASLQHELRVKLRYYALLGAKTMAMVLENAISSGQLSSEKVFDTDHVPVALGFLAESKVPKYHTAYDRYLDWGIRDLQDSMLEEDEALVYAILTDYYGYVPTHNSRYSLPLTGDPEKDRIGNQTKQIFKDAVSQKAAKFKASDNQKVLFQSYRDESGKSVLDVAAPVTVMGRHWGAFRIGYDQHFTEILVSELRNSIIISMLLVLAIASLTGFIVVNRMTNPLVALKQAAILLTRGRVEKPLQVSTIDEIGELSQAFNTMSQIIVKNLRSEIESSNRMVMSVKDTIQKLSANTGELLEIAIGQASGATQQAAAVQEATTTSEEIAATAKQVQGSAQTVEELAARANLESEQGEGAITDAVEGMVRLRTQVESIAEGMLKLGENSQKIGGIIDIIDDISDQTNLLSLNAAIEAAGAGEAGKLFSVVANEVQRLADQTVKATDQVKNLVEEIQRETNTTIMLTEEGTKGVDAASGLVSNITNVLANIKVAIETTTTASEEIKIMTRQQTSASDQMADTVAEVRDVANQFASNSSVTQQSITELKELAEHLQEMINQDLKEKGKMKAVMGGEMMEKILSDAVDRGIFTLEDLFDEKYIPIPNTDPPKYHTRYDRWCDEAICAYQDSFLDNELVAFAVLVDRNGYLPTHNTKFSQPLTGDREKDLSGNRTKRLFDHDIGLNAARNEEGILIQQYERDTGEKMWDISVPVRLKGKHWGAFRIGYWL